MADKIFAKTLEESKILETLLLSPNSLIFCTEEGREMMAIKGGQKLMTAPFLAKNDTGSKVLASNNGLVGWTELDLLDLISYGVEWSPNIADPELKRVGNRTFHRELPIQSQMKGCVYDSKNKQVVYWLNEDDWRFKKVPETISFTAANPTLAFTAGTVKSIPLTGSTQRDELMEFLSDGPRISTDLETDTVKFSYRYVKIEGVVCKLDRFTQNAGGSPIMVVVPEETKTITVDSMITMEKGSNLSGYDGEVMVYIPEFWIKSWDEDDRRCVRISPMKPDSSWEHQPSIFVAAYKDTILRSVPSNMGYLSSLTVNSAVSIANSETYCRGGNNSTTNDTAEDIFKSCLGKCVTSIPRGIFRGYARLSNKEILSYRQYKNILYWLYVIEYANFNIQDRYNANLTSNGFHQGGLGTGITNVPDYVGYNGSIPICPNGYTNEIGNRTGTKLISPNGPSPVGSVYAVRYRGLENIFGDASHNLDGIVIIPSELDNSTEASVYTTDNPSNYRDDINAPVSMNLTGMTTKIAGYIKEWALGSTAEIIPRLTGGTQSTYKCDYYLPPSSSVQANGVLIGGANNMSGYSGLGFINVNQAQVSLSMAGYRTVSIPDNT